LIDFTASRVKWLIYWQLNQYQSPLFLKYVCTMYKVKKVCTVFQKLFWPLIAQINLIVISKFLNSLSLQPWICKSFPGPLEHFFIIVSQNNFFKQNTIFIDRTYVGSTTKLILCNEIASKDWLITFCKFEAEGWKNTIFYHSRSE
jgi:hypothetical protein